MTKDRCPIWGTPATHYPRDGDRLKLDSPRAGGIYSVSGTALAALPNYGQQERLRLTSWLVEQRTLGNDCPVVSSVTLDDASQRAASPVVDRADRILKFLASRTDVLGAKVRFRTVSNYHQLDDLGRAYLELLAQAECVGETDLDFLLDYLDERGALRRRKAISNPEQECALTVSGHSRLAELQSPQTESTRAFVAMWFDRSMDKAWQLGFRAAVRDAGYDPVRIDQQEYVSKIDDEIISEIRRSRFVVADFTHGDDGARGGVYYEAGFAHGLHIPVFFCCREDKLNLVHFDTRQYNHIVWKTPDELREKLFNRIAAAVGNRPLKS